MKILRFIREHKLFSLYTLMVIIIICIAVFAPLLTEYNPTEAVLQDALEPPNSKHIFGTDALGRDVFSRVLYGSRTSVSSTLILTLLTLITGTLLGITAGFFGGIADTVIMRTADIMLSFPDLILAMAISGILGANLTNAMIAIIAVSWTKYARLSRSLILKIKHNDYIKAAEISGTKKVNILIRYLLPNIFPTMIITAATDIGTIMLSMASLSFLGFGVQPPTPEWGYMLSEGRNYIQSAPWLLIFPGLAIFITVAVFNLMGDGIRDLLDNKSK
jgi:ABC-type dipeptide/oligopeptide/nickel transport system permease subunit